MKERLRSEEYAYSNKIVLIFNFWYNNSLSKMFIVFKPLLYTKVLFTLPIDKCKQQPGHEPFDLHWYLTCKIC